MKAEVFADLELARGTREREADAAPKSTAYGRAMLRAIDRNSGAILAPPCRCFVDLPYGARLDAYEQRQSTVLAKTLEQFLG